ncbi:hypothetical protein NKT34_16655 [Paenibacillus polysaccharolyticus]|uniref:hypothetical protein n=1 Tax=Paenibacillus polysaccharolyticus TaxID=582692 RepID=UPI0020A16F13|nr:hypothetical protein [Paenibacillus polysaccharolyticus]MCP1134933.1 hypothetical protein [Paenibacillus polysaccharolyticus]
MKGQSKSNKAEAGFHHLQRGMPTVCKIKNGGHPFFIKVPSMMYPFGSVLSFTRSPCANVHIASGNDHKNGYSGEKQQNTPGNSILCGIASVPFTMISVLNYKALSMNE